MKDQTFITLPTDIKRMARMAAAEKDLSLSAYVAILISTDCRRSGIAQLVTPAEQQSTIPNGDPADRCQP